MSVITTASISYLPYAMYQDPGLPDRVWAAMVQSVGDASGGTNLVQLNLKAAGVSPGNLFSLEQLSVESEVEAELAVRITTDGMQTFNPGNIRAVWTAPLLPNETDSETIMTLANAHPRLWLGRGFFTNVAGTIAFRTVNTNTLDFRVFALGYMWTAGALNAPGGPRRPESGVFSN